MIKECIYDKNFRETFFISKNEGGRRR